MTGYSGTVPSALAPVMMLTVVGQLTTGPWLSVTMKSIEQEDVTDWESVALHVPVDVPTGRESPELIVHVTVRLPSCASLAVAG